MNDMILITTWPTWLDSYLHFLHFKAILLFSFNSKEGITSFSV